MKHKLLLILSLSSMMILMTACSSQVADKMAELEPTLSSDPCVEIDRKVMRLDRFIEVVKNTSAFHLEEKAAALPVPGITVSNNRKQMLRDAEKKYVEYAAEQQKYGCKTPMTAGARQIEDKMTGIDNSILPSDSCAAIDQKMMRLDRFTEMVKNTSAFHLEEKAAALPVPGISVSNNRKQMLRDAEKKYAEYAAEHQKQGCKTPMSTRSVQMPVKKEVANKPVLLSEPAVDSDKKVMKTDVLRTKVNTTSTVDVEEKAIVVPEPTVSHKKEPVLRDTKQKQIEPSVERQKDSEEAPRTVAAQKMSDKTEVVSKPTLSSDACTSIVEDLIRLDEFATMVNNTSAFHLQEKAEALSVPGITVSNNKKKMLRDVERKRAKLLVESEKQGCETVEKK